jgi:hypothetical protein
MKTPARSATYLRASRRNGLFRRRQATARMTGMMSSLPKFRKLRFQMIDNNLRA